MPEKLTTKHGHMVLVRGLEGPDAWETGWTGVFPTKREAQRELTRMRRAHPAWEWRLGALRWDASDEPQEVGARA